MCNNLVVRVDHIHLLGDAEDWILVGYAAVQRNLLGELCYLDSMRRVNDLDWLQTQSYEITEFGKRKTEPFVFWKIQLADCWERGIYKVETKHYESKDGILAYTYVWVVVFGCIFGSLGVCCMAPLIAAMRYNVATLHPKTKPFGCIYIPQLHGLVPKHALYTLSGLVRPA